MRRTAARAAEPRQMATHRSVGANESSMARDRGETGGGPSYFLAVIFFLLGFASRHVIDFLSPRHGRSGDHVRDKVRRISRRKDTSGSKPTPFAHGIYPLLRDFRCGHDNLETPRALKDIPGRGRVVVDVGLDEGQEMLDAVENGFVVFGFEMMTGSMAKIRTGAEERGILDRLHFVEFVYDRVRGFPVAKNLPKPPRDGTGFAYVFNAGVSDEAGSMAENRGSDSVAMMKDNGVDHKKWSPGRVPILRLDQALPRWVERIFFLKIDTQGNELRVLNGASTYLRSGAVQYALYELSPKLMRAAKSGDPYALLQLMLSMGAMCFDMMGAHHDITRPSAPLVRYYESLNSGRHTTHPQAANNYMTDPIGPWDDILCWFPGATV